MTESSVELDVLTSYYVNNKSLFETYNLECHYFSADDIFTTLSFSDVRYGELSFLSKLRSEGVPYAATVELDYDVEEEQKFFVLRENGKSFWLKFNPNTSFTVSAYRIEEVFKSDQTALSKLNKIMAIADCWLNYHALLALPRESEEWHKQYKMHKLMNTNEDFIVDKIGTSHHAIKRITHTS